MDPIVVLRTAEGEVVPLPDAPPDDLTLAAALLDYLARDLLVEGWEDKAGDYHCLAELLRDLVEHKGFARE